MCIVVCLVDLMFCVCLSWSLFGMVVCVLGWIFWCSIGLGLCLGIWVGLRWFGEFWVVWVLCLFSSGLGGWVFGN